MSEESDNGHGGWGDEVPPLEPRGGYGDDGSSAPASDGEDSLVDGENNGGGGEVGYVTIRSRVRSRWHDLGGAHFWVDASGGVRVNFGLGDGDGRPLMHQRDTRLLVDASGGVNFGLGGQVLVSPSAPAGLLPLPDAVRRVPRPRSTRHYDVGSAIYQLVRWSEPIRPRIHPIRGGQMQNYDWYRRIYHYSFRLLRAASLQMLRRVPDHFSLGRRFGGIEVIQGEELSSLAAMYSVLRREADAPSYWRALGLLFEALEEEGL